MAASWTRRQNASILRLEAQGGGIIKMIAGQRIVDKGRIDERRYHHGNGDLVFIRCRLAGSSAAEMAGRCGGMAPLMPILRGTCSSCRRYHDIFTVMAWHGVTLSHDGLTDEIN